jgi:hypothetical protein
MIEAGLAAAAAVFFLPVARHRHQQRAGEFRLQPQPLGDFIAAQPRQSDAQAALRPGHRAIRLREQVEHPRQQLLVDTDAVVADPQGRRATAVFGRNPDVARLLIRAFSRATATWQARSSASVRSSAP